MKSLYINKSFLKLLFLTTILFVCIGFSLSPSAFSKEPRMTVTPIQGINFGTICVLGTSASSVKVDLEGRRTSSGGCVLLNIGTPAQYAIYEVKFLKRDYNVQISYAATTNLTNSNGGSLVLDIGPIKKVGNGWSGYSTNCDDTSNALLYVGGTLHIPQKAVSGNYSGTVEITFELE